MSHLDADTPYISDPDHGKYDTHPNPHAPDEIDAPKPDPYPRGSVQAGGYCAPSDAIADLIQVSVPRGGLKWPTAEEAAQQRLERDAMEVREADRRDAERRHKREVGARNARQRQRMSTVRVAIVLLFVLLLFMQAGHALPWQ